MKKIVRNPVVNFSIIILLAIVMSGCGGRTKSLADGLGAAAGAATVGILCFLLGC